MEILILHPGALGDIILSLPALSLLRRRYPHANLTLAGNLDFLQAVAKGYADQICSLSTIPLHRLYSVDPLPEEDLRFWRSKDRIVSWTGAGDAVLSSRFEGICACARVARWRPNSGDKRHVARIFVESLYPWIPPAEVVLGAQISPGPAGREEARAWLGNQGWTPADRLVALHPGAGSVQKRWSVARYRALAGFLVRQDRCRLLVVEGPAEPGLGRDLVRTLAPGDVILAESLPLTRLAGLLCLCSAYVGNDSGISHLAAGLGVPSVVLFGPTSPDQWAPLGEHVKVLRAASLDEISPDVVFEALQGLAISD